jgi:hypothetical protein
MRWVVSRQQVAYLNLKNILSGSSGTEIAAIEQSVIAEPPSETVTILSFRTSVFGQIGSLITETDREFRRVAALLSAPRELQFSDDFPYSKPIPTSWGGFRVIEVSTGSLHVLVEPFGMLVSVLASQPVTALIAAQTLWQNAGTIRAWLRRRHDELDGVTAHQALSVLRNFGGDAALMMRNDTPRMRLEIEAPKEERPSVRGIRGISVDAYRVAATALNFRDVCPLSGDSTGRSLSCMRLLRCASAAVGRLFFRRSVWVADGGPAGRGCRR